MADATFVTQTLSLLTLLVIASFTYVLSKKINFMYTVMLVFIGILLVPLSNTALFWFIDDFKLTPNILFFVFLPVLLFEWAYNINYRSLLRNWKAITSLAVVWLFISAIIISSALYFALPLVWLHIPFLVCFLFWALISATDPVAVLSTFKKVWAPRRLTMLFEWESLFNDGTSVALFMVILWIILEGWVVSGTTYLQWWWEFLSMLFGGIVFWIFTWVLFSKIIGYIKNNEEVEIVLTIILAHFTFIMAEVITLHFEFIPISWVIATVVASIIIWNYGRYKITPKVEAHMQKFWKFFAFISNSLVFILMGLILSSIDVAFSSLIFPILVSIPIIVVARSISVYIPISLINFFSLEERIPKSWQHLLSWGSLRWALAIMMVLMIPGVWDPNYAQILEFQQIVWWDYPFDIRDFLIILTVSSIMFTLFIKAPTIWIAMKKAWISKLNTLEEFEHEEGSILANLKILEKLNTSYKKAYLTQSEYDELTQRYSDKLEVAIKKMKRILSRSKKESDTLIRRALSLHALWIEKQYLKDLFLYNEIDERNFKYIFRKIEKQMERVETDSPQLRKISNIPDDYDIFSRFAIKMYKNSSSPVDTYIRNRARVIITRKVIKELRQLSEIDFGFGKKWKDNEYFKEIIDLYAYFNRVADEKRIQILLKNRTTIMGLESRLVNKSLLKLEEQVFKDLYKREIITPKLYVTCKEEIEEEIFTDVKRIG